MLIVGAGSAGCVVAAALSADPDRVVTVVEAGPVWPGPGALPAELRDPAVLPVGPDSVVARHYPGNLVRGRLIGGSGAINGSYYVRATAADHRAWQEVAADPFWAPEAVLATHVALERDADFADAPWHGSRGPVPVRRIARLAPVSEEFVAACARAGFAGIADLNAPSHISHTPHTSHTQDPSAPSPISARDDVEGVGPVPCALDDHGRRAGPALTHLYPAAHRPNLTVIGDTTVTRLRLTRGRVTGVEWRRGRARGVHGADRVILCAGAVESAALLIRSGIGPVDQLLRLGIPVAQPAPVGRWCTDHPEAGLEFPAADPGQATVPLEAVLLTAGVEVRPYTLAFTPGVRRIGVALTRPRSVGVLELRSADPDVPARVDAPVPDRPGRPGRAAARGGGRGRRGRGPRPGTRRRCAARAARHIAASVRHLPHGSRRRRARGGRFPRAGVRGGGSVGRRPVGGPRSAGTWATGDRADARRAARVTSGVTT
ncbi:GMC family oxidoreductase N-terminal domain-containing protein [Nocardia thailandica]|uniref:GMC family oxidoreductase N-terminal domain-containing protein n=1 Tax=Nocardia thailandica TaxID=257275 RepID=UPI00402BF3CE